MTAALVEVEKPTNRELLSKMLSALARREHTEMQLRDKLRHAGFEHDEVQTAIQWCAAQGFVCDERFAEGAARLLSHRYGATQVARKLAVKGVARDVVAELLPTLKDGELDHARALWLRRFGQLPASMADRAKQIRFLQSRGFGFDVIKQVLAG